MVAAESTPLAPPPPPVISVSNAIVPLESGKLIVLSFVGLTALTFVSCAFAESPSKAILVILLMFWSKARVTLFDAIPALI